MTVTLNSLNFSIVTNNDDMIQINVKKRSNCLPADIAQARWEMFFPGTRIPAVTKENSDITILDGAIKFLLEHTDTVDLIPGEYVHEPTIITVDGRIHTVTEGDLDLTPGIVTVRKILTDPP